MFIFENEEKNNNFSEKENDLKNFVSCLKERKISYTLRYTNQDDMEYYTLEIPEKNLVVELEFPNEVVLAFKVWRRGNVIPQVNGLDDLLHLI